MTDTRENIKAQLRDSKGRLVSNKATPTLSILEAVDQVMRAVRQRHPEVPPVVLVVGASGKRAKSMVHGHFAPDRWEAGKSQQHEISLSGESLERGAVATLGTILHESAHALAAGRGLKDTSREGRYHNKVFKAVAAEVGIDVAYDPKIGWSETTVPDDTVKLYRAEVAALKKALKAYRRPELDRPKAPSKTIKLECECRSVRVPKSFYDKGEIQCVECGDYFQPVE